MEAVDRGSGHAPYRIPVEAEEADGFYQRASNWEFLLDDGQDPYSPWQGDVVLSLALTAHRDDPPG